MNNISEGYFVIAREKADISFDEFYRRYFVTEVPVIIEGAGTAWPATGRWNSEYLVKLLKQEPSVKLKHLWYQLDHGSLQGECETPAIVEELHNSDEVFPCRKDIRVWVNTKGHVAQWHYDGGFVHVFNAQVTGQKEWFLISPETPLQCYPWSNFAKLAGDEDNRLLVDRKHTRFVLNEGDMIYLPPLWFHKVLSQGEENINFNWIMTSRETQVLNKTLEREMNNHYMQFYFSKHRIPLIRSIYARVFDMIPDYLRYQWLYDEMIKTPYKPNAVKFIAWGFREIFSLIRVLLHIGTTKNLVRNYKPVQPLT